MSVTYAQEILYTKLEHVELHIWHAFCKFLSGTSFLHQTECSSIPCKFVQERVWTWIKFWYCARDLQKFPAQVSFTNFL